MNETELVQFIESKIKEKLDLTILEIGIGTGRFGGLFRQAFKDYPIKIDGVEKWPGSFQYGQELSYDHIWCGDIRDIWNELPSYDLVIIDGLSHYIPSHEIVCVLERARYLGPVLMIQALHNVNDKNPFEPLASQVDWSIFGQMGAERIGNAWFFGRQELPATALILRSYNRHFMTKASILSLVESWLPPSYLIFLDDCSVDPRNRRFIEDLDVGLHEKIMEFSEKKFEKHYETAQRGIEIALSLDPKPRFVGFCDTDFIYNPKWYQMGVGRYDYIRSNEQDLNPVAFTSFHLGANSRWHKYNQTVETPFGRACIRKTSGWGNILVDYDVAKEITKMDDGEDASYADRLVENGRCIVGTIPSYVQHVGANSSVMGHVGGDWAPDFIMS